MLSRLRARKRVYRPSDEFLRQIDHLERSSPDFSYQLADLFKGKGHDFNKKLGREDREWLVEYLDNVCALVALYLLSLNLL